ncbi:MAG TPA: twin-arginine translocase subunit TatC, partial [Burkholderiaceae bacterium]|nr:twin-arginine translocase subunit TatC [Burkholderiaceae bacterium]
MAEDKKQEELLAEGTLMSHLLELRNRLLKAVVAVLVAFIPCAIFANELFTLVAQPLIDKLPKGTSLIATSVVSPFMTPFKVAFYVALFIAIPVVLYQIWAFVAPGLYRREKRFAVPLLVSSVFLFYAGVVFAYFAVFPVMFSYLVLTAPAGVNYMPDMASYLD